MIPIVDADADYVQRIRAANERRLSEMSQSERSACIIDADENNRFSLRRLR